MPYVVVTSTWTLAGPKLDAKGPWPQEVAERERRRLLADFAYHHPYDSARSRFRVTVVELKREMVAP